MKERTEPAFTTAYRTAHAELEKYAETARLEFVWSIVIRSDETALEVVSNLSAEQQAARADPMEVLLLFKPYKLPPVYLDTAKNMARRTGTAVDGYGSFRSCIEPVKISNGNVIFYSADMEITWIADRLRKGLISNVTNGLLVMTSVVLIAVVFSNRISHELRDLVKLSWSWRIGRGVKVYSLV